MLVVVFGASGFLALTDFSENGNIPKNFDSHFEVVKDISGYQNVENLFLVNETAGLEATSEESVGESVYVGDDKLDESQNIYSTVEVGNEVAYIAQDEGEQFGGDVVFSRETIGSDPAGDLNEVGGKLAYISGEDYSKQVIKFGEEEIGPFYDIGGVTNEILSFEDKPLYFSRGKLGNASETNQMYVYHGEEMVAGPYSDISESTLNVIDGEITFEFTSTPQYSYNIGEPRLYYGGEIFGDGSEITGLEFLDNSYNSVFNSITYIKELEEDLLIKGRINGSEAFFYRDSYYGEDYSNTKYPFIADSKFAYVGEKNGEWYINTKDASIGPFASISDRSKSGQENYFIGTFEAGDNSKKSVIFAEKH